MARREKKELSDDDFNKSLELMFGHGLKGQKKARPEDLVKSSRSAANRPDDIRIINKSTFSSRQQDNNLEKG